MMKPEWCLQWALDEVQRWEREEIVSSVTMTVRQAERHNRILRLRALLDAHQRGRREGMEEAAEICNERGIQEQDGFGLGREAQNYYRARDAIRAKAQEVKT